MSVSLVADYESSSSESESDSANVSKEEPVIQLAPALEMLDENTTNISSSVFNNPYREAENYELSVLERHVKLTSIKETVKPKKVCFKFNKGKCKLGDKCQFLHHNPHINNGEKNHSDSEDQLEEIKKPVKKRSGLTDDLVPPKKFMKTYYQKK